VGPRAGMKNLTPTGIRSPDRLACSESNVSSAEVIQAYSATRLIGDGRRCSGKGVEGFCHVVTKTRPADEINVNIPVYRRPGPDSNPVTV
jgi:hypothetical protein